MSPYTTGSASSSETAVECSQAQLLEQPVSATNVVKGSKKNKSAPKQLAPGTSQAIAGELDSFFGGPSPTVKKPKPAAPKRSSRTQEHLDRGLQGDCVNSPGASPSPPPYEAPAHLAPTPKPRTIARYLFMYGFFFPPFWVIGAFIILSPLRSEPPPALAALPKDVEAGYAAPSPEYERAEHGYIRRTELMWAKRCLAAALTFIALIVLIIVVTRLTGVGAFAHAK